MCKTIAVANQKGGVGKTMTATSLAVGLAKQGRRVLCLDADAQHSLTVSLGITEPAKLSITLATALSSIIQDIDFAPTKGIIHHPDGVDLLPSNHLLAGLGLTMVQQLGRETILRQYIDKVKTGYDFIIVDCAPTLDVLTINALAAADSVIIPVVPSFLDAKGLELLLKSIAQIRRQINPALSIEGILLTMVDRRATFTREIVSLVELSYGSQIRIFGEHIPRSVRAAESTAQGVSIFTHDPRGKVAAAYAALVGEVLSDVA